MAIISDSLFGSPDALAEYEYRVGLDCVLPKLVEWDVPIKKQVVLDVGCGAGGLTRALAENLADCFGIDVNPSHIEAASRLAKARSASAEFAAADILKAEELDGILRGRSFHLIVLSEVLEHLLTRENVSLLLSRLRKYLALNGHMYVSFPPWFNPFGGHQAGWPRIRYLPWFHLLPLQLQQFIAPVQFEQYRAFFRELNHLTVAFFERSVKEARLNIVKRELFHLRPEYYWRYGVPAVRASVIGRIPGLREVTTTGAYYLLAAR